MKRYSTSKLLVVFVIVLLLSLPYAFAGKPDKPGKPEAPPSWSVYIPTSSGFSDGIRGFGDTPICLDDVSCPEGLPNGDYYVYAGNVTENDIFYNKVGIGKSRSTYSGLKFQFTLDSDLFVKLGVVTDGCDDIDIDDPDFTVLDLSLDCVLSIEQPNEVLPFFNFAVNSFTGIDIAKIPENEPVPLRRGGFLLLNRNGTNIVNYYNWLNGELLVDAQNPLTITKFNDNVWEIIYAPTSHLNFDADIRLVECVPINNEECSYEYNIVPETPYTLHGFVLYFVRE